MDTPKAATAPAIKESVDGAFGLTTDALAALAQMGEAQTSPAEGNDGGDDGAEAPEERAGEQSETDLSQPESDADDPEAETPEGEVGEEEDRKAEAKGPEWFQKRLGHYTARAKAAEEEAEELRAELKRAKGAEKPPEDAAVRGVQLDALERMDPELARLAKEEAKAESNVSGAESLLDALETDPDRTLRQMAEAKLIRDGATEVEARQWLNRELRRWSKLATDVSAERRVQKAEVKRRLEGQYAQAEARAAELHPWLKDAKAPERASAAEWLKRFPNFRQLGPDWAEILGYLVEGKKAVETRKTRPATPKAPPPKLPGVPPAMGGVQRKTDSGSSAKKRAMETGTLEDVAAALST